MGISIEEVKEYEKSFERSLDDTGINFITLRDYVNTKYIPKDQYEARLKADMVAMLEEIKEQLREMHEDFFETEHFDEAYGVSDSMDIIQEKIDALKEK